MGQIGTVAVILLFSMGFMLWLASDGAYGNGFLNLMNAINSESVSDLFNLVVVEVTSLTTVLLVVAGGIIGAYNSNSLYYTIGAALLSGVASLLLSPFTFITEVGALMPTELIYLINGVFALLIILAAISFVTGRDF